MTKCEKTVNERNASRRRPSLSALTPPLFSVGSAHQACRFATVQSSERETASQCAYFFIFPAILPVSHPPQQTGVWFIRKQHVQPASIILHTQSQHAWIISQHLASPLVQVMLIPSGIISHLHMPIVKLQQQTIMPFIMQQQLHMPPVSIVHRFCIMLHAALSSQEHVIFMPPLIFSILKTQRGTIM
jgi:hypothetical protein